MSTLDSDAVPDSTSDVPVALPAAAPAADAAGPEGDVAQPATSSSADDSSANAPAPRESTPEPVQNSVVSDLRIDDNAPHPVTPPAPLVEPVQVAVRPGSRSLEPLQNSVVSDLRIDDNAPHPVPPPAPVVEPVQVAVRPGSRSYEDEPPQAPEATTVEEPENTIQFGPQGPRRKRGSASGNGGLELPSVGPSAQGAMAQPDSSTSGLPPLGRLPSVLPTSIKDPETSMTTDSITGTVLPPIQPRTDAQLITDTALPVGQPAPLPGTQLSPSDAPSSSFGPSPPPAQPPVQGIDYPVTSDVGAQPLEGRLQRNQTTFATGRSMTDQYNVMRLQQSSLSPGMAVKVAIAVSILLLHDVVLMLIVVAAARADFFDSFGDDDDKYTSERFNTRAAEAAWAAQPPPIPAIASMQEVDTTVVISTAADPSSSIKFTDAQGNSMLDLSSDGEVTMTTTSTNNNITMASGDALSFSASGALSFSQGDAEADSDRLQLLKDGSVRLRSGNGGTMAFSTGSISPSGRKRRSLLQDEVEMEFYAESGHIHLESEAGGVIMTGATHVELDTEGSIVLNSGPNAGYVQILSEGTHDQAVELSTPNGGGIALSSTGKVDIAAASTSAEAFALTSLGGLSITSHSEALNLVSGDALNLVSATSMVFQADATGVMTLGAEEALLSTMMTLTGRIVSEGITASGATGLVDTEHAEGVKVTSTEVVSVEGSGGVHVSAGSVSHFMVAADADDDDLTLGATGNHAYSVSLLSGGTNSDAVVVNATHAGGGVLVEAGSGGIGLASASSVEMEANGTSLIIQGEGAVLQSNGSVGMHISTQSSSNQMSLTTAAEGDQKDHILLQASSGTGSITLLASTTVPGYTDWYYTGEGGAVPVFVDPVIGTGSINMESGSGGVQVSSWGEFVAVTKQGINLTVDVNEDTAAGILLSVTGDGHFEPKVHLQSLTSTDQPDGIHLESVYGNVLIEAGVAGADVYTGGGKLKLASGTGGMHLETPTSLVIDAHSVNTSMDSFNVYANTDGTSMMSVRDLFDTTGVGTWYWNGTGYESHPAAGLGIGIEAPQYPLELKSGAHCTRGGVWMDASSRMLKDNISSIDDDVALAALNDLHPVTFNYKAEVGEQYVGFIAEDVPELVATSTRKTLAPMSIVAVLVRSAQLQQQRIAELEAVLAKAGLL